MDAVGGIDFEVLVPVLINEFIDLSGTHIDPCFSDDLRDICSHSQVAWLIVTCPVAGSVDACELIEYVFVIGLRIGFIPFEHCVFAVPMHTEPPSGECAVCHSHKPRKHCAGHETVLECLTHVSDLVEVIPYKALLYGYAVSSQSALSLRVSL